MAAALAKQIRAVVKYDAQETWDLAGYTSEQVTELVPLCFSEPFPTPLRFSFVVGGGRLVRARYDQDLQKWLSASLRELGFEEDRGASLGSTAAYKRQEDLAQNLVFFHVFPKVAAPAAAGGGGGGEEAPAAVVVTPAQRLVACTLPELQRAAGSKIVTWSEKRRANGLISDALARIDALEARMGQREPLTDAETTEYAALDRETLGEKAKWLTAACKEQVANGLLTAAEFAQVLKEMDTKLGELAGVAAGGGKAGERAAAASAELTAKRAALAEKRPVLPPVARAEDIRKARAQLERLRRLERDNAGKVVNLAVAKEIGAIPEWAARVEELERAARGYFETDEEWAVRDAAMLPPLKVKGGKW
jgi:hypothetical protein